MWLFVVGLAVAAPPEVVDLGWGYTHVYALAGEDGIVVVDTNYPKKERRIVRRLERADLDPDRVRLVLLTHAHADHAGSAGALSELLEVPIAVGAPDVDALAAGRSDFAIPTGGPGRRIKPFLKFDYPPTTAGVVVTDMLDLSAYGVDAVATVVGGHTPGSMVVRIGDEALVGDAIRAHLFRRHRPALHFFHEDVERAHGAVAALLADGVTTFYPTHGGALSAERVRDFLGAR